MGCTPNPRKAKFKNLGLCRHDDIKFLNDLHFSPNQLPKLADYQSTAMLKSTTKIKEYSYFFLFQLVLIFPVT